MKLSKLMVGATVALALGAAAGSASASQLLYRNDFSVGFDYLGAAVNASGYSVTSTADSISGYNLSDYSVVVYANQNSSIPDGDLAQLNAYIAGGGHVIFDDWTQSGDFNGGETFGANVNETTIALGSQFSSGISGTLSVVNTGWGVFSTSLGTTGDGVSAATFLDDGTSAIVVGNGGRTIVNGFLSDTVASQQLYANELASLAGGVPEPSTWAMMLVGFGGLGAVLRRRARLTQGALQQA